MTLCTLVLCMKKSSGKDLFLFFLPSIIHTLGVLKHQLKSTFNKHSKRYTHETLITVYQLKPVSNVMTLCTLFKSLNKYFRQILVLVLSTQYHTHPGCTQTPIEINFQSTLSNIYPCNSIHSVSIEACLQCNDVMHVI